MKIEDKLKQRFGSDPGFRVPDGYFEDVYNKISASLPERVPESAPRLSAWQRVRPYVYLAAMFAGIWCMMKMFHMMTSSPEVSLDNPPVLVSEALTQSSNADMMLSDMVVTDYKLEEDVADSYDSFDDFVADFDYEFENEYEDIDLSQFN